MNVIAVFDVGKTNKKLFLFDEQYRIVSEQSVTFQPAIDEDRDSCEDLPLLSEWVRESLAGVLSRPDVRVKAVNFSAYGASFVHVGADGQPVAPLYNYLKPYPGALKRKFYHTYGGEVTLSMLTASPVLGSLNSGMQLYRLKTERPELWGRIRYSLHLPQYLSFLLTGNAVSDITSIGCHTNLWNFAQQHYHEWVYREGVIEKLAPIVPSNSVMPAGKILAGVGLHDSSAAMILYLESFPEPFVLISTGTWCITMNPFNATPLTVAELQQDCLCYMTYQGRPVKASRLFAGYDHEQQVRRLADYFQRDMAAPLAVGFDHACVAALRARLERGSSRGAARVTASVFGRRDLAEFESFDQAYHCLMMDIMDQQVQSTSLVLHDTGVRRIFVDGGFGKNQVYMHLLAEAFPDTEVYAASIPQATAMGAALAIHGHWNGGMLPGEMIELKRWRIFRG
ncbi:MAG TPA: FGGY family carbohydrate kinase [Puia sp.]|jgi:sugar (pentulose or hexulose) kinase|nr:FGGY family carbohydrate kinase [Puia sp.]